MALPDNNDRSRPTANRAASNVNNDDTPRVPRTADHLADLDALAEHLRAYLVLQVTVDDNGHRRTQVYRSAAAVERAVRRAQALIPTRPCVWCGSPTTSNDAEPMHPICATAAATRGGAA